MSHQSQLFVRLFHVITLVVCCSIFAGCRSKPSSPSNQNPGLADQAILATVNGRPIPAKLYEMYLKNGREALRLDPDTEEGRNKLAQLREGIVSELIDRFLIAQEAERRGLSISAEQLTEAERRSIAELGGDQRYETYLAEHRMSRDEYREVIRMQVYGQLLRDELKSNLTVADKEIEAYYKAHRADPHFQKQELVTAAHILIAARPSLIAKELQESKNLSGNALDSAVRQEMAARRQRAEALRKKAATGADFVALARESSEDPGTKASGGDLGTFPRDSHSREFDVAAFSLKPGQISSVIQTEYGFHVIKVSKHEPARAQTLFEASPEIRRALLATREAEQLAEWLKDARRKASVQINEPFRFGALQNGFRSGLGSGQNPSTR